MTNDPTGTSPTQTVTLTAFNAGMLSDKSHTLGEDIFINGLNPPLPTPPSPNDGLSTIGIILILLAVIVLIVVIYKVYKYRQMKRQEAAQRE